MVTVTRSKVKKPAKNNGDPPSEISSESEAPQRSASKPTEGEVPEGTPRARKRRHSSSDLRTPPGGLNPRSPTVVGSWPDSGPAGEALVPPSSMPPVPIPVEQHVRYNRASSQTTEHTVELNNESNSHIELDPVLEQAKNKLTNEQRTRISRRRSATVNENSSSSDTDVETKRILKGKRRASINDADIADDLNIEGQREALENFSKTANPQSSNLHLEMDNNESETQLLIHGLIGEITALNSKVSSLSEIVQSRGLSGTPVPVKTPTSHMRTQEAREPTIAAVGQSAMQPRADLNLPITGHGGV
ncbi:MAG: hypothetical protein PUP92_29075 [Rhizonema sp. PD38]|nr:hypothetical protein [Rhizonema sp. PD38]